MRKIGIAAAVCLISLAAAAAPDADAGIVFSTVNYTAWIPASTRSATPAIPASLSRSNSVSDYRRR